MRALNVMHGLFSGGAALAAVLLLGRLTGLIRESFFAAQFGLTGQGDAAAILLSVPDLLLALLVTGGMNAALVPRIARLADDEAINLTRRVGAVIFAAFTLIAILFALFPRSTFGLFAPGSEESLSFLTGCTVVLVAAAVPIAALSGVSSAWLNARQRYLPGGFGTLIFNLALIATVALWSSKDSMLLAVGVGVVLGAATRLVATGMFMPLRDLAVGSKADTAADSKLLGDFAAGAGGIFVTLLPPIILRAFASFVEPGALVSLNYAQKLVELPVSVLFGALGTVALTEISHRVRDGGGTNTSQLASGYIRRALALAIVVALAGWLFATPVAELIFGYGKMGEGDVSRIASLFAIGCASLPFTATALLCSKYLYANGRVGEVLSSALLALLITPLLAAAALAAGELRALMAAYVAIQAAYAFVLWRRTGLVIITRGSDNAGIVNSEFAVSLLAAAVLVGLSAAIVHGMGIGSPIVTLIAGSPGVLLASYFAFRTRDS